MLRSTFFFAGVLLLAVAPPLASLGAQPAQVSADPRAAWLAQARDALAPFAWLVGEWEGTATIHTANGGTMSLQQRESVTSAAFATALIIQGRGMMNVNGSPRQLWDAAGLFAYDTPTKTFSFSSASGSGLAQTFAVSTQGSGFTWSYVEAAGARVRYVITRTADDKWKEIGERSEDGGATWTTTIDLLLARKD